MKASEQTSFFDVKPSSVAPRTSILSILILGAALSSFYYFLGMRKAKGTNLTTIKIGSVKYDIVHFGVFYFWSNVALDLLLGLGTALIIIWAVQFFSHRSKGGTSGAVGTVGIVGIAIAFFGCPTCTIPLAGTLGLAIFGTALPLLGTEFKLIALLLLALSIFILNKQRNKTFCSITK